MFTNPRWTAEELKSYYERDEMLADIRSIEAETGEANDDPAWHIWVYKARLIRSIPILTYTRPLGRILEIGCGRGDIIVMLKLHQYDVYGVELNLKEAEVAKTVIGHERIFSAPIETDQFEKFLGTFDTVVAFSLLEHIASPVVFVRRVADLLKPGGKFILHVPNVAFYLIRTRLGKRIDWQAHHHLHHYSMKTLSRLLARANLQIVDQFWHEYPYLPHAGVLREVRVALECSILKFTWLASSRRVNMGSTLNVVAGKSFGI